MTKRVVCALLAVANFFYTAAQFRIGAYGGLSNYQGDLADYLFTPLRPAVGVTAGYGFSERFTLRAGIALAKVEGSDRYGGSNFQIKTRNLHFASTIKEASIIGEWKLFNLFSPAWSSYILGGFAVFRFNPYTFDSTGQKVYLRPLSTEGQGLPQYPNRKPYSLTAFAIPVGGGIKFDVNDYVQIAAEIGVRKLFTDYLDDISTTYIDPAVLLQERGPLAVALSYRGDEVPGETPNYPDAGYPLKDAPRGSPVGKDWYYFSVIHLHLKLGAFSGNGKFFNGRYRMRYECPPNPVF